MSIAPILSWQSNKIKKSRIYVLAFLTLSAIVFLQSYFTSFNTWGFIGITLGSWILLSSFLSIVLFYKIKLNFHFIKNINSFLAHIGVGILIIGVTSSSIYKTEENFTIEVGNEIQFNNTKIELTKIKNSDKSNHSSLRAVFVLKNSNNKKLGIIEAGKNYYYASKIITTEAGIFHLWLRDIYIVLGNQKNSKWSVKIYDNPLVSFIWLGVFIMIYSGIIAVIKK
tara:strand:- start:43 stop:717 length:675 start_codon:yes stop_codon:yes gene_type:complete